MVEALKDVGNHNGTYGTGHYEARVLDDGSVKIETKLDGAAQEYTVYLTCNEWKRLAAWVEWAQSDWNE